MNNLAFQIYGSKKTGIFQSTWDTTLVSALGSEQAAISASGTNWALNTGATNLNVGGYKHTVGSTTNLTTTLAAVIMQMYQITYTISSRTAGSVTINYGGVSTSGLTTSSSVNILATATTVFSITPTSDFDGIISISVKQTSSATNQIKLPLPNTGTYNIWVDWGDGTYNNITSYNSTSTLHTYPVGITTPTIRITGDRFFFGFSCGGIQDRLKIKTISSWGKLKFTGGAFCTCSNLTLSRITDVPDLSTLTTLQSVFVSCFSITTIGRLNEWNTSTITSIGNMFESCTSFNQYIGNWDISNVTFMNNVFKGATSFNNGSLSGIANQLPWNTSACTDMSFMFQGANSCNSNLGTGTTPWNVSKVTTFFNMFYLANKFNNGNNEAPMNNWIINTASDVNMTSMFPGASLFNREVSSWNVSKVIVFSQMFNGATSFNNGYATGIANQLPWTINTTSTSVSMNNMFAGATAFNSNLGTGTTPWDVSKVTSMFAMFNGASKFNNGDDSAPINNWNINTVSSVSMGQMFQSTNFNRYIGDWNVSKVTAMGNMFLSNTSFNQDLSKWNVGSVTSMDAMFYSTNAFTNGSNTNTNPITGLTGINGWNINTTAASVTMDSMFAQNTVFNQPINSWNVSKVTSMNTMFYNATAFNQNIGSWNVSNVTNFSNFMYGKTIFTFSSTNLDAIYNGWSALPSLKPNLTNVSFGTAKYTSAAAAGRLKLTSPVASGGYNWGITDGGQI